MYVLPVLYSCRAVAVPLHRVLYSRRALTIVQSTRVVYILPVLYSCRAVAVPLHRVYYWTGSPGNVRFTRFVLVPCCGCTIAPRSVLAPCVDYCTVNTGSVHFTRFVFVPCCGCTIAPCVGNVPFTSFCTRAVRVLLHRASTGRVLIDRVRTRAVTVPLHSVYRACSVISSHSCWTSSSLKGSTIPFLGLGVKFVYQRFNCSPLVGHFFYFFGNINYL